MAVSTRSEVAVRARSMASPSAGERAREPTSCSTMFLVRFSPMDSSPLFFLPSPSQPSSSMPLVKTATRPELSASTPEISAKTSKNSRSVSCGCGSSAMACPSAVAPASAPEPLRRRGKSPAISGPSLWAPSSLSSAATAPAPAPKPCASLTVPPRLLRAGLPVALGAVMVHRPLDAIASRHSITALGGITASRPAASWPSSITSCASSSPNCAAET
mmetsp:Transcript_78524/g.189638  ORF Transcript_78524/g.189638 Transcript_78524/m.189638 type:complete len:217 (+) Transcript_78524:879-1529(+)